MIQINKYYWNGSDFDASCIKEKPSEVLFRNRLNISVKLCGVTSRHVLNPNCKHPKNYSGRCVVAYNIDNPEAGNAR